jgi:hypothetical protein
MLRQSLIALALTLLPVAASAQEHQHGETGAAKKAEHSHMSAMKHGEHVNFAQLIMQKRAELKLTDEQVAKLEDVSVKMQQHHAAMGKPGTPQATEADHAKMHDSLMSIFTEEQAVKVRELMKQHKDQCGMGEEKQCKMETAKKTLPN